MLRSVRGPSKKGYGGLSDGLPGRVSRRPGARQRRLARALCSLVGIDQPVASASAAVAGVLLLAAFVVITTAYYAAIRRHDVELSLEERLSYDQHVQTVGNRSLYVVDSGNVDPVFSRLSHEDWTKVSTKIDYVAFLYDRNVYLSDDDFDALFVGLESISPHGYGMAMFPCGCLIHNMLLQHVSVRFDGMECAMLPGLILETAAVKWVNTTVNPDACKARRDALLSTPWYDKHSWKLQRARDEYARLRLHLTREAHPDRPVAVGDAPAVRLSGVGKTTM